MAEKLSKQPTRISQSSSLRGLEFVRGGKALNSGVLIQLLAAALILIATILLVSIWHKNYSENRIHNYPANLWQAVFLDNGQVYFGHVTSITSKTVVLKDIYYLQVVNQPLQRSQEPGTVQEQEQRLTLIKLGNEIHGPYDEMNINRDRILIIENLKNDSRVVTAITKYISEQSP